MASAEITAEEREGLAEKGQEDVNFFPSFEFNCLLSSTHLGQAVSSGMKLNPWPEQSSFTASFFAVFLLFPLTNVLSLHISSCCGTCAATQETTTFY